MIDCYMALDVPYAIDLANALKESQQRNLTLALDKSWSSWYLKWFE